MRTLFLFSTLFFFFASNLLYGETDQPEVLTKTQKIIQNINDNGENYICVIQRGYLQDRKKKKTVMVKQFDIVKSDGKYVFLEDQLYYFKPKCFKKFSPYFEKISTTYKKMKETDKEYKTKQEEAQTALDLAEKELRNLKARSTDAHKKGMYIVGYRTEKNNIKRDLKNAKKKLKSVENLYTPFLKKFEEAKEDYLTIGKLYKKYYPEAEIEGLEVAEKENEDVATKDNPEEKVAAKVKEGVAEREPEKNLFRNGTFSADKKYWQIKKGKVEVVPDPDNAKNFVLKVDLEKDAVIRQKIKLKKGSGLKIVFRYKAGEGIKDNMEDLALNIGNHRGSSCLNFKIVDKGWQPINLSCPSMDKEVIWIDIKPRKGTGILYLDSFVAEYD
jgi:hypothetical protein